jgi:hypothetical protein
MQNSISEMYDVKDWVEEVKANEKGLVTQLKSTAFIDYYEI